MCVYRPGWVYLNFDSNMSLPIECPLTTQTCKVFSLGLQICFVHLFWFLSSKNFLLFLNTFLAILTQASTISLWMTPSAFYCLLHPISSETYSVLLPHWPSLITSLLACSSINTYCLLQLERAFMTLWFEQVLFLLLIINKTFFLRATFFILSSWSLSFFPHKNGHSVIVKAFF